MNNSFIDRVNAIVQQNQSTDPAYPDAGIGALENVANNVPRQAQLMNQPHMLAYINPQEEQMLRDMGGAGLPGPDGIPVYGHGGFHWTDTSTWNKEAIGQSVSNVTNTLKDTASNVYDTVSTGLTNVFGDQGYIETAADKIYDFDGDSTPTNTGTNTTTATNEVVREPNELELSYNSTKTQAELEAEARAAGQEMYMFQGNYYPVPVEEPVETTNSVVAQDFGQVYDASGNRIDAGALPTGSNSVRETIANLITPFDSAYYEDGTLYGYDKDGNVIDLTGGGESYNSLTGTSNYVYGVSDDPTTGTTVDTTGMSEDEATVAEIKDELLRDIPPSDLAYFGSFFGNNVIPIFGGYLAGKMLDAGIDDRRAIVDEQISALETGATPLFNDAGEYIGFDTSTMTGNVSAILDEYGAEGLLLGGLPEDVATEENERFNTVFDVQSAANENDPTGMSTEDGFITTGSGYGALDGTEYYIEGDGSVQEVTDGIVNYDNAKSGETVDSVYGINDEQIIEDDPVVKSIYNKYYKSGKGTFLPPWLRRFSSGVSIDELLTKIEVDGEIKYQTPEGEIIDAKYITGAIVGPDTTETE